MNLWNNIWCEKVCHLEAWGQVLVSITYQSHLCLSHIQPRAPYDFYHPYDFLPVRPSEVLVGILRSRGLIRLRARYGLTRLYTFDWVEWFAELHGYPVRYPYGHRAGPVRESTMFFISYGTRAGPVRMPTTPFGTRKGIDTTRVDKKFRTGVLFGRTGGGGGGGGGVRALAVPARLFTGCLGYQNPYGP